MSDFLIPMIEFQLGPIARSASIPLRAAPANFPNDPAIRWGLIHAADSASVSGSSARQPVEPKTRSDFRAAVPQRHSPDLPDRLAEGVHYRSGLPSPSTPHCFTAPSAPPV